MNKKDWDFTNIQLRYLILIMIGVLLKVQRPMAVLLKVPIWLCYTER